MVNRDGKAHLRFPGCVAHAAQLFFTEGTQAKMLAFASFSLSLKTAGVLLHMLMYSFVSVIQ